MLHWVLGLPPKWKCPPWRKENSLNSAHQAPLSPSRDVKGCADTEVQVLGESCSICINWGTRLASVITLPWPGCLGFEN